MAEVKGNGDVVVEEVLNCGVWFYDGIGDFRIVNFWVSKKIELRFGIGK